MADPIDYILKHPLYLVFIILNVCIIIWVIIKVINDDKGEDGKDDDDDPFYPDDPDLDLPPGVSLPEEPGLVEEY